MKKSQFAMSRDKADGVKKESHQIPQASTFNHQIVQPPTMTFNVMLNNGGANKTIDETNPKKQRRSKNRASSTAPKKMKRNRLSFVCQACRAAKSKCDKEKPECGRCYKLGISCIYDTAIQTAPKHLSKDLTILRLENEVDFWQKKTKMLLEQQEKMIHHNIERDDVPQKQDSILDLTTQDGHPMSDSTVIDTVNGPINFNDDFFQLDVHLCQRNPRLIMSRVMKKEVNPMSPNYLMINDTFFAIMLMSIFLKSSSLTDDQQNKKRSNITKNASNNISREYGKGNPMYSDRLVTAITADISISRTHQILRSNIDKLQRVLLERCPKENQKQRGKIATFCKRIQKLTGTEDIAPILKEWMSPNVNDHLEDCINIDPSDSAQAYIEDGYSPLLKRLIETLENTLPPLSVIQQYKRHFYENIYAMLPFVDLHIFEDVLKKVLIIDPNDSNKCKIQLGTTGIRNKMENICILACILKISYMFFSSVDENELIDEKQYEVYMTLETLHKYPIENDIVVTALRCIIAENWASCPNENIITILAYLWAFFMFSPDEGDFFANSPTEYVSDLIIMLASSIGLHRDPNDYSQISDYKDKRLKNHRRLLWLSIISMSSYENALKGRRISIKRLLDSFIDISSPKAFDEYMERVKNDVDPECELSTFILNLHEIAWRRTHLSFLHQNLNILTMSYSRPVTLWEIEKTMSLIDAYVKEHLLFKSENVNILQLNGSPENILHQMRILATKPSLAFISQIMGVTLQLRTSYALMLYFENRSLNEDGTETTESIKGGMFIEKGKEFYLPYYMRYMKMSINNCLRMVQFYEDFYSKSNNVPPVDNLNMGSKNETEETDLKLASLTKYYVSKFLQISLSSTMFTLLVIIVRLEINRIFLEGNNEWGQNEIKINTLSSIQDILRTKLKVVHNIATSYLKYAHFSVFKILSMYDLLLHRLVNDRVVNGLFKPITESDVNPQMVRFFKMCFNIQFSDGNTKLLDLLRDKNHISLIAEKPLVQLLTELRNKHKGKIEPRLVPCHSPNSTISIDNTDAMTNSANGDNVNITDQLTTNFLTSDTVVNDTDRNNNTSGNIDISADPYPDLNNMTPTLPSNVNAAEIMQYPNDGLEDLWQSFNPNEDDLSKTFTGMFGSLDMFDFDYFFNDSGENTGEGNNQNNNHDTLNI